MHYRTIGKTGIRISAVGFGAWATGGTNWGVVDDAASADAIRAGIDAGITLIDTAPVYGAGHSEEVVGAAVAGRRDSIVLSTKCGLLIDQRNRRSLKPADIGREVEASCRRLATDRIDILFCHWPDPQTPVEETMQGLLDLKKQGKIRAIGLSNHGPELVRRALAVGPVDCLQDHFSLLRQDVAGDHLALCREAGLSLFAYAPLGGGILSGKYAKRPDFGKGDVREFFYPFYKEPHWTRTRALIDEMQRVAARHATTVAGVAVAWVNGHQGVGCALVGAKNPEQAAANAAAGDVVLSDEETAALTAAGRAVMT